MKTLLFIDDRPCTKNRPCSFNNSLFERNDFKVVLMRFTDSIHQFPDSYINKTSKFVSFIYDSDQTLSYNFSRFDSWTNDNNIKIDFLCCMSEPKQEIAQSFGRLLKLPSNSELSTLCLRNKYLMKRKLSELGIQTAKYSLIIDINEIPKFLKTINCSAILKPLDMYGAIDTTYIDFDKALDFKHYNELLQKYGQLLIEEYISDEEYECCSLIYDKKLLDTFISYMPSKPIETKYGAINANISLPLSEKLNLFGKKLDDIMTLIIDGFELTDGYVHMEYFYSTAKKTIIVSELAHRFPGCEIAKNHGYSHGFDILNSTINCYIGINPSIEYKAEKFVGDLLLPYKTGFINSISSVTEIEKLSGVLECTISFANGDILENKESSSFLCSGWVIIEGSSVSDVLSRMENVLENYHINTTNLNYV